MHVEIIAAVILSISALLAAWISRSKSHRTVAPQGLDIPENKQRALSGDWLGTSKQYFGQDLVDLQLVVEMHLICRTNHLDGNAKLSEPVTQAIEATTLIITGRFVGESHLILEYQNEDPNIVQFGSCLLELNKFGNELTGFASGFGPGSNQPISTKIKLVKKK